MGQPLNQCSAQFGQRILERVVSLQDSWVGIRHLEVAYFCVELVDLVTGLRKKHLEEVK